MLSVVVKKFKLILPAYIFVAFMSLLLPLLARWTLDKLNVDVVKLEYWELYIPLCLPWLFIYPLLRPRLALLKFKNNNHRSGLQVLVWLCIGLTGVTFQLYYTKAAYPLVYANGIHDFEKSKRSRFYQIKWYRIVGSEATNHVDVRPSDKGRELRLSLYTAVPFDKGQAGESSQHYWFGFLHSKSISNRLSETEKKELLKAFLEDSWAKVGHYDFGKIRYLEKLSNSADRDLFLNAIAKSKGENFDTSEIVILTPRLEPFTQITGDKLYWGSLTLGIGTALFIFILLFPPLSTSRVAQFAKGNLRLNNPVKEALVFFLPDKLRLVGPLIMGLNILAYLTLCLAGVDPIYPNGAELLSWGANRRLETIGNGEWWRLVTNMFLHGGILHLLLNMYGLALASLFIEPMLGKLRVALLYLGAGIISSLASVLWYENTISVGASGAIFGLLGGILGLTATSAMKRHEKKAMYLLFLPYIGISLAMGLAGGIDNAAHIGGLLSGAMISSGMYFSSKFKFQTS